MTKEALKLALEALEYFSDTATLNMDKAFSEDAITAIKEALMSVPDGAQPEQEPVAIADGTFNHNCPVGTPLYTTPPQRTWVGLTLDDIPDDDTHNLDFYRGGRWAERILKEKNT